MSGKASRRKGKAGELEVRHLLDNAGFDHSREQDGTNQPCDFRLHTMPAVDLEVRRREQLSLTAWSREIEAKTPEGRIPAVAYRINGEPWRCSLPLSDFIRLLKAAEFAYPMGTSPEAPSPDRGSREGGVVDPTHPDPKEESR